jgi:pimeloyl-[acyl-carrier protein] methyl ester esterase
VKTLLFVHGWGFDASFWAPVAERLPDFRRAFVDLGFRGQPATPDVATPVVVAHSMGLAWALANVPRPWGGLVAVNSFARFTRAPDFVSGVVPRLIERMVAKFADEPGAVTADFLSRCGVESPDTEGMDTARLGESLRWLAVCDERAALAALDCPVQALAATRDMIVPEQMSRESFARHPLVVADGGGHLLPHSHPEWVAQNIRQFAAGLP